MSSSFSRTLSDVFSTPETHPTLGLIKSLKEHHPSSQHVPILQHTPASFPLSAYLASINVPVSIIEPDTHSIVYYDQSAGTVYSEAIAGVTEFTYHATAFRAYKASWDTRWDSFVFYDLVFAGATDGAGQALAEAVFKWANALKDEIWVFEDGCWAKNKALYKAVRAAEWEDIVLDEGFKRGLQRDTETFFTSKDVYGSLGITWKRGILLLGPPGNGKTESIKALLKDAECAVLYVKTFNTQLVSILSCWTGTEILM